MAKKNDKKTYEYYTFSVPNEMRVLFEAYISKYPSLGFRNVGQYLTYIIQGKAEDMFATGCTLYKILFPGEKIPWGPEVDKSIMLQTKISG